MTCSYLCRPGIRRQPVCLTSVRQLHWWRQYADPDTRPPLPARVWSTQNINGISSEHKSSSNKHVGATCTSGQAGEPNEWSGQHGLFPLHWRTNERSQGLLFPHLSCVGTLCKLLSGHSSVASSVFSKIPFPAPFSRMSHRPPLR